MKRFIKYLLGGVITSFIVILIMLFPPLFFSIQDKKVTRSENSIAIPSVDIETTGITNTISIEEKIALIEENPDVERIALETGDVFSLYEARKQSMNELYKITSLEVDVYGPYKDDIDIRPYLMIHSKTPSKAIIVWQGSLVIKDITYQIVLDEEVGKIIRLNSEQWKNNIFENKVLKEWQKYIKGE